MSGASSRQPSERVARRRSQTRERLLAAAAEIIAEDGAEGLRLREIANRADVALGSFYQHFSTKEDLVEAVVTETVESLASEMVERASQLSDPAEAIAVSHRFFIGLATSQPQLAWVIVNLEAAEEFLGDALRAIGAGMLERGIESGRFRQLDIEAIMWFSVGATVGMLRAILEERLPPSVVVDSTEAFLCVMGIDPQEAAVIARQEPEGSSLGLAS